VDPSVTGLQALIRTIIIDSRGEITNPTKVSIPCPPAQICANGSFHYRQAILPMHIYQHQHVLEQVYQASMAHVRCYFGDQCIDAP
jgi:hypothetical protein